MMANEFKKAHRSKVAAPAGTPSHHTPLSATGGEIHQSSLLQLAIKKLKGQVKIKRKCAFDICSGNDHRQHSGQTKQSNRGPNIAPVAEMSANKESARGGERAAQNSRWAQISLEAAVMRFSIAEILDGVRDVLEFSPLAFSVACIIFTAALCQYLRGLVRSASDPGVWRQCLEEMVAAFELCGCAFELVIIADNYGVSAYAVALFLLTIWWSKHWGDATACPYTYIEDLLEGRTNYGVVVLKTIFGLIGALSVFKYIQVIWGLEMVENHKDRATAQCTADLQVPVLYGALVELVATFVCRVSSRTIGELGPKHGAALDSFIGTSLVVLGFNSSGGYYNPLLATGLKMGCLGHSLPQFFFVYWLAATLGSVASSYFFRLPAVHSVLVPAPATVEATKPAEEIDNVWAEHED